MSVETNTLPDDPAELKQLLLEQHKQLHEQRRTNAVLEQRLEVREQELADTRQRLAKRQVDLELVNLAQTADIMQ